MRRTLTAFLVILAVVILLALLIPAPSHRRAKHQESSPPETDRMSFLTNFPDRIVSPTATNLSSSNVMLSGIRPPDSSGPSGTNTGGSTIGILATPLSSEPDFTNPPPAAVIENMRGAFRDYAARFGGNPVGTNPEITRALNGGNPKQITFIHSEDGLRINERGELIDPWGTPFFFHQLSAREMEIHSAGPDHMMWTADDLVTK
jgi:hypothetical protein